MAEATSDQDKTRCKLCGITFNDPSQAPAHYKGQKHLKKLKANGLVSSESTLLPGLYPKMCPACPGVELTSIAMEESHCKGAKHVKKLNGSKSKKAGEIDSDSNEEYFDAQDGSDSQTGSKEKKISSSSSSSEPDGDDIGDHSKDFCSLCLKSFNHVDAAKQHYKGSEHRKKVQARDEYEKKKASGEKVPFCDVCVIMCNTREQLLTHEKSPAHLAKREMTIDRLMAQQPAKRSSVRAPEKDHPPLKADSLAPKPWEQLIRRQPRSYQKELYEKALTQNVVIFLPTGMGKTLTSELVVSHLLQDNPTRQIIFIVDRKLLVFQQGAAFRNDLCEVKIGAEKRSVRVALVCGDRRKLEAGCHYLYDHDIVVITAGSYENLLKNGELRWKDVSLVVFDEAHHCVKKHPYRMIVKTHYETDEAHRPKIVGLTASPAGAPTVDKTQRLVLNLLDDMHCKLAKVTESKVDYDRFRPKTQIRCVLAPMTAREEKLRNLLNQHGRQCLNELQHRLDVSRLAEIDINSAVFDSTLEEKLLASFGVYSEEMSDNTLMILTSHILDLFEITGTVNLNGVKEAKDGLMALITPEKKSLFPAVSWSLLNDAVALTDQPEMASAPTTIVEEVLKLDWNGSKKKDGTYGLFAMILVAKRVIAVALEKYLNEEDAKLASMGIRSIRITGHGGGKPKDPTKTKVKGMTTKQQEDAMRDLRAGEFNVVVATSVAEEGVDLPECKLVIQTEVPRTLTSLVQIRGRARAEQGEFVAICRSPSQAEGVRQLEQQEKNMEEATDRIIRQQNLASKNE